MKLLKNLFLIIFFIYSSISTVYSNESLAFINLDEIIKETNYGKTISSMNLLILHPNYHTFFHLQIPNLEKETKFLIEEARKNFL